MLQEANTGGGAAMIKAILTLLLTYIICGLILDLCASNFMGLRPRLIIWIFDYIKFPGKKEVKP